MYKFVEDSTRDIEDNAPEEGERANPSTQEMANLEMWVHHTPSILNQGRVKHTEPKAEAGEEEVEPEVLMAKEVEKDPWEPRLKPLTDDANTRGGMPAWILRAYGHEQNAIDPKTKKATLNHGTIVVKSKWWPGQYSFYNNGRVQQLYCGDGLKAELPQCTYYPISPPMMMHER